MATCDECGYEWDATDPKEIVAAIRTFPKRFTAPVTRFLPGEDGQAIIRTRPEPGVWSALEYVAHTRDAIGFYSDRVRRVVQEERPQLTVFNFAEACDERRYNDEDPAEVVRALGTAATQFAEVLEGLDESAWQRAGIGSGGDERSVLVLARSAHHEGHHHLLDVGRVLRHVREMARS